MNDRYEWNIQKFVIFENILTGLESELELKIILRFLDGLPKVFINTAE
ncbi:MAG: hypothetical protein U5K35_19420 [Rhodohalobacter sp.]|nr:hypothetical protein [Rhodohalobacter sp.]